MKQHLTINSLIEKYPEFCSNVYCGFGVGDGWLPILDKLFNNMKHHVNQIKSHNKWYTECKNRPGTDPNVLANHSLKEELNPQVAQVKEKFGLLRIYIDNTDEYIDGLVSMAESISAITCEDCGLPGEMRDGGWLRTLCNSCDEAVKVAKKELFEKYAKTQYAKTQKEINETNK